MQEAMYTYSDRVNEALKLTGQVVLLGARFWSNNLRMGSEFTAITNFRIPRLGYTVSHTTNVQVPKTCENISVVFLDNWAKRGQLEAPLRSGVRPSPSLSLLLPHPHPLALGTSIRPGTMVLQYVYLTISSYMIQPTTFFSFSQSYQTSGVLQGGARKGEKMAPYEATRNEGLHVDMHLEKRTEGRSKKNGGRVEEGVGESSGLSNANEGVSEVLLQSGFGVYTSLASPPIEGVYLNRKVSITRTYTSLDKESSLPGVLDLEVENIASVGDAKTREVRITAADVVSSGYCRRFGRTVQVEEYWCKSGNCEQSDRTLRTMEAGDCARFIGGDRNSDGRGAQASQLNSWKDRTSANSLSIVVVLGPYCSLDGGGDKERRCRHLRWIGKASGVGLRMFQNQKACEKRGHTSAI
ncbi:hypothetical protein BDY19DRAFT_904385 [Irpex rosettiformis]|uniref:Uncharacterized protein n=1 Tax=Irpex rosettiformis TaxID=378272 RepID=A0ACB8UCJ8_9APHY|nr:hypothetical protein BDY19DRAFT_904385 [Irpex rosettiformis]